MCLTFELTGCCRRFIVCTNVSLYCMKTRASFPFLAYLSAPISKNMLVICFHPSRCTSKIKSVRKVFASLDRKSTNKPISFGSGQNEEDTTTGTLRAQNSIVGKKGEDTNPAPAKHDTQRGEARHTSDLPNHLDKAQTGNNAPSSSPPSSSTNEPPWDFESFLEEQRCRELQHDDRKEKAFQKVLSALGGNGDLSGAPELPPEIVQAWGARNERLSVEAGNAQKRQQKLEVNYCCTCVQYKHSDRYLLLSVTRSRPRPRSRPRRRPGLAGNA